MPCLLFKLDARYAWTRPYVHVLAIRIARIYVKGGVYRAANMRTDITFPCSFLHLEVATPTRRPFSGRGCHALTWRSHGHAQLCLLPTCDVISVILTCKMHARQCLACILNEWPSRRSTDSVGLATATNTIVISYLMQCIPRRVLTYTKTMSFDELAVRVFHTDG